MDLNIIVPGNSSTVHVFPREREVDLNILMRQTNNSGMLVFPREREVDLNIIVPGNSSTVHSLPS